MTDVNSASAATKADFANQPSPDAANTDRVAEAAHAAVDIAAANLAQAEEALREARRAAGITVTEKAHQAQEATEESLHANTEYFQANPLRAVGIAAAAGFLYYILLRK